jgi:hypothetical protein
MYADCSPQMQTQLPPGIVLVQADNFENWLMDIRVLDTNPIYEGETYRLKFTFSQNYPIEVSRQSSLFKTHSVLHQLALLRRSISN